MFDQFRLSHEVLALILIHQYTFITSCHCYQINCSFIYFPTIVFNCETFCSVKELIINRPSKNENENLAYDKNNRLRLISQEK